MVENRPAAVKYRVLLLPGFLCTDVVYRDMLDDPAPRKAGIQLVAGNPPGFKGLPVEKGFDFSIEDYAEAVCDLNDCEPYDLIVGHSFFANVLIEVAASDRYHGPLMLLSPSLSREAEDADTRFYDRISRIPLVCRIGTMISYQMLHASFAPYFIEEKKYKIDGLVAEARKSPGCISRRLITSFFDHMDRRNLASRLARTDQPVMYIRGADDPVRLLPAHRRRLSEAPRITIKEIKHSKHFVMIDHPGKLNQLIIEFLFTS